MSLRDETTMDALDNPIIDQQISKTFIPNKLNVVAIKDVEQANLNNPECAGRHFIADFHGANQLDNIELMEKALTQASEVAGATLLHIHLHTFADGGGITGVALLAESHISVHTWPELNYAAFDAFMCGNAKPEKAVALLEEIFKPDRVEIKEILRG
jgi:S-adenosylmethionine decarboxylase